MCDSMQSEQDLAAHADDLARAAELRKLVHAPAAAAENDALWQLHAPHATEAPFRASPRDETTAAELIQVRVPPAQLTEHLRHGRLLTRPPSNATPPAPFARRSTICLQPIAAPNGAASSSSQSPTLLASRCLWMARSAREERESSEERK